MEMKCSGDSEIQYCMNYSIFLYYTKFKKHELIRVVSWTNPCSISESGTLRFLTYSVLPVLYEMQICAKLCAKTHLPFCQVLLQCSVQHMEGQWQLLNFPSGQQSAKAHMSGGLASHLSTEMSLAMSIGLSTKMSPYVCRPRCLLVRLHQDVY